MSESIQKVLTRRRPPRVKITYDVETGGAMEKKELPFIVGIMADLSGDEPSYYKRETGKPASIESAEKPAVKERKFVEMDTENFDDVMKSFTPGTKFSYQPKDAKEGDEPKKATLAFEKLDDFSPIEIVKHFSPLTEIYNQRADLRDMQARLESDDELEVLAEGALDADDSTLRDALIAEFPATSTEDPGEDGRDPVVVAWEDADLAKAAGDHTPSSYEALDKDEHAKQINNYNRAVGRFTQLLLAEYDTIKDIEGGVGKKIDKLVIDMDTELTYLLDQILHDENFQALEASWRALHYLVANTETSTSLKLRVLNISRKELKDDLYKAVEFDQSHLFKIIYEAEYGTYGGAPYSALMGDYYFGRDPESIGLLEKLSQVAASAHAPFIASTAPDMFGLKNYDKLAKPRDLAKIFESVELNEWRSFRDQEDSRYVALTLPRVLMRLPYGSKRLVADGLRFEEQVVVPVLRDNQEAVDVIISDDYEETSGNVDAERCLWGNPAFFLMQRITRAFTLYGWTAAIRGVEGGGLLEGLPNLTYTTAEGDIGLQCPTEASITDRREKELNDLGFIAACHCKGQNKAAFFGGKTANSPKQYLSDSANANAELSSMLPYVLAASRFAHYVKVIMRDKVGSFMTRGNVEAYLNEWIAQYILLDDEASQEVKAAYPLREARVDVTSVPGKPGTYNATMFLKPHFQLEDLTTSIRLVAELPA